MKNVICRLFVLSVLVGLVPSYASYATAGEEPLAPQHIAILRKLEGKIKSNYQTIYSWQGVAEFSSFVLGEKSEVVNFTRSKVVFCADKVHSRHFSLVHQLDRWNVQKDKMVNRVDMPLDIEGRMLVDDVDYLFADRDANGPLPPNTTAANAQSVGLITLKPRTTDSFPINDMRFFNPEKNVE